jgi:hypothetical protein
MRQYRKYDALIADKCACIIIIDAYINKKCAVVRKKRVCMANRTDWIPTQEDKPAELMANWQGNKLNNI